MSLVLMACGVAEPEPGLDERPDRRPPSRREIMHRFYEDRSLLVVYGASEPEFANAYRTLAQRLARERGVRVQSDAETSFKDLASSAVYLIGTPRSNRWIGQLAGELPVSFHGTGFALFGRTFEEPEDLVRLLHPNPANPSHPLFFTSGNSDAYLSQRIDFRRLGDFQVMRAGKLLVMGTFQQGPRGDWVLDPETYRVFEEVPEPFLVSPHFAYYVHGPLAGGWEKRVEHDETLYQRTSALIGDMGSVSRVRYHLYASNEEKGLVTGNTEPAHYDPVHREIHASLEEDGRELAEARTAELLVRLSLDQPLKEVLERGLAVYVAESGKKRKAFEHWAARLYWAGQVPPLTELLDNDRLQTESSLIVEPLAGSFVSFLLEDGGEKAFLERYPRWDPGPVELEELEGRWAKYLARRSREYREVIKEQRERFPEPGDGFQKGFTHAHEGYQIFNGYLSKRSDDALRKLLSLGTDSVAIVPYTYMRDPRKPAPFPIPRRAGSETDEGTIHAVRTAKSLGMTVMLKPHIWLHSGWPGEIRMTGAEDRERFFDHYYRWIRHYALLAERLEAEILCVGVELAHMTEGNEGAWTRMIRELRKLYSGRIVYAANWDRELEQVKFWGELDYIGVNAYYPVSRKAHPTDGDLRAGFRRALEKIRSVHERYRKPVLLTEIGFASTPAPWRRPHEGNRRGPVSLEDQARSYQWAFAALRGSRSWMRGTYWWKWPSDLSHGGPGDAGFTPNGKPAEDVVRRWYTSPW
ncbi:MAG: hypothetical protein ACE5JI_00635 [Acidobacteriota bacterium]